MRSLSLHRYSKEALKLVQPGVLKLLKAYADGVNAYVAQMKILPLEFLLTGSKFEQWEPVDTIMMGKLMEFTLSISWQLKAFKSRVAELHSIELMKEILQTSPEYQFIDDIVTVIHEEDLKAQNMLKSKPHDMVFTNKNLRPSPKNGIINPPISMSNSWVLSGKYTKSGKPLLANDPHLTHKMPGIWYLMTLKFPYETVTGFSISGIPAILIGRNEHIAWGYTASTIENIDMHWLDIDFTKKAYFYDKKWVPLKVRKETIKVKNSNPVEVELYDSHHGPVILRTPAVASSLYLYFFNILVLNI